MKPIDLIHWIHAEMQDSQETTAQRHIIRFKTRKNYALCLQLIKALEPKLPRLSLIKPLKTILGLSCSLTKVSKVNGHPLILSIEEDLKTAVVHSFNEPTIPWGITHIKAPEAWKQSTGKQVKIGVIDTGIDYSHPDLQHSISGGINLINRHMLPIDDNGHGTHIAGTIAAEASQQGGVTGVAPQGLIYVVKAFDYKGSAFISDIIYGMEWCVRNQIQIINMSFGMKNHSKAMEDAVRSAYLSGTVIVASSGNSSKRNQIDYPARFPYTISVGAISKQKKIALFSNRGNQVDIYAPGEKIMSTWLHGKYNELSGTSMATSHVSGVIALMLSSRPSLTPHEIKMVLKKTALPFNMNKKNTAQSGQIQAVRTLNCILKHKRLNRFNFEQ